MHFLMNMVVAPISAAAIVGGVVYVGLECTHSAIQARVVFDRELPPMKGNMLNMKVVDLRLGPNESSAPHKHGCAVVVYVISGAMRMQVRGGRDSVYRSGETFHERPDDVHQVSANASVTDSAHFTATFVCDHVGPLSTPAN